MSVVSTLVRLRRFRLARELLLAVCNLEVQSATVIGSDVVFHHRAMGTVLHPATVVRDRVQIYHGVTTGRADSFVPAVESRFRGIELDDDCVLCPGSRILSRDGVLRVGKGTVVAANAVLLESTGDWEVWAGAPARRVGVRTPTVAMRAAT